MLTNEEREFIHKVPSRLSAIEEQLKRIADALEVLTKQNKEGQ